MERETVYFTVTGVKNQPSAKNYIITIVNMTEHTKDLLPSLFYVIAADNGSLSAWSEGSKTTLQCCVKSEKSDKNIMSFLTNGLFATGTSIPEVQFIQPDQPPKAVARTNEHRMPLPDLPDFTKNRPRYEETGPNGENLGLLDLRTLGENISADILQEKNPELQKQREAALGPQIIQILEDVKANLPEDLRPALVAFRKLSCVQDMFYKAAVFKGLTAMLSNPSAMTDNDIMLILKYMGKDEAAAAVEKIIIIHR